MKNLLIISILSLFLSSCEESFDLLKSEQKPVINCFFSPDDTLKVHVSKSLDVFNSDSLQFVHDAKLGIYSNDILIANLYEITPNNRTIGFYKLPELHIQSKKEYVIKGEIMNCKVQAKDIVPDCVEITKIDTLIKHIGTVSFLKKMKLVATVYFNDPIGKNYYAIALEYNEVIGTDTILRNIFDVQSSSPSIEARYEHLNSSQIIFSDKLFDGKIYSITFSVEVNNSFNSEKIFNVKLLSISENYYKYAISYYKQILADKDFYSEPSAVYSNISGALGVFAAYTESVKQINYIPNYKK